MVLITQPIGARPHEVLLVTEFGPKGVRMLRTDSPFTARTAAEDWEKREYGYYPGEFRPTLDILERRKR